MRPLRAAGWFVLWLCVLAAAPSIARLYGGDHDAALAVAVGLTVAFVLVACYGENI